MANAIAPTPVLAVNAAAEESLARTVVELSELTWSASVAELFELMMGLNEIKTGNK